ncbi:MAG: TIM barrel protein [Pirellulaceae bacterium]|nr:TIM barrel protein [Pirellulaceae bacterium]
MARGANRREFIQQGLLAAASLTAGGSVLGKLSAAAAEDKPAPYKISLAEWSLHRAIFGGRLDHLDFAKASKEDYGIDAVEYVNQFFMDKATDRKYLADMKQRAADLGVKNLLIMVDREGRLGDPDDAQRTKAVENHYKWVEAAKFLGCHSLRVNAASAGTYEEQLKLAADGLRRLSEFAAQHELNVIVENHGGLSSNGKWLAAVMEQVNLPNCGTLPDFGNFGDYDRYQGVAETMPYAKAVSAKSHEFDADGNEVRTDYRKMMKIVLDHKYHGYVGIEYEGQKLDEPAGIRATKKLLDRVAQELA